MRDRFSERFAAIVLLVGVVALHAAVGLNLAGCTRGPGEGDEIVLGIHGRPSPMRFQRGALDRLPVVDPAARDPFQVDLRSHDLSQLDLTGHLTELLAADFDTETIWPANLPDGFDPELIMELGRSPGLGVKELHQRGITGQGIGIAILDQPLIVEHAEYGERLRHYEELSVRTLTAAMHGPAVASIALGETVGVAPEAELYYLVADGPDVRGLAPDAIERFLVINRLIPPENRIRAISISVGLNPSPRLTRLFDEAAQEGVLIIPCGDSWIHGVAIRYHGLERSPNSDPEDTHSYRPVSSWGYFPVNMSRNPPKTILYVPMSSRCVAGPTGVDHYAFYRVGGWSWCAPYIAGLYVLGCQVKPDLDPETFYEAALATGRPVDITYLEPGAQGVIVDPVALIEALETGEWVALEPIPATGGTVVGGRPGSGAQPEGMSLLVALPIVAGAGLIALAARLLWARSPRRLKAPPAPPYGRAPR